MKKKLLIVVDMQNDFISGSLGSPMAQAIVPKVQDKVAEYIKNGDLVWFTRDTHNANYLQTQEGTYLPVEHCIEGTWGHEITAELQDFIGTDLCIDKPSFGSLFLANRVAQQNRADQLDEIELIGVCTDICVVSNALILKARLPEIMVTVDASCCAGVSEETHNAALLTMKTCQVNVINGEA